MWPKSTAPLVSAESECSGSSIITPRGTYSSVPPDQAAACNAANLSARWFTTRNKCGRTLSLWSRTSSSRLPNNTPCLAEFGFEFGLADLAVKRGRLAAELHAVGQQGGGQSRGKRRRARDPRQTKLIETEQANVGAHPFFVGPAGQRQILENLPGGAAVGRQPIGLVAACEKSVEGILGEPACECLVSKDFDGRGIDASVDAVE